MAISYVRLFPQSTVLFIAIVLLCSSCFDIKEEIYLKKDGSGTFRLLLDFSSHKEMLRALAEDSADSDYPTFGEKKPFEEMIQVWTGGALALNEIKGIDDATAIVNKEAFIYGWQFSFADVNALNLVLALKDGGEFDTSYLPPYSFQKKELTKQGVFSFFQLFAEFTGNTVDTKDAVLKKQKKAIFAGASYQCTISVEGKVRKYNNKEYKLSSDKKRLLFIGSLLDVQSGKAYIGNLIKFK